MKDIIKIILTKALDKTYPDHKYSDLIEVQNVIAKNIKADFFSNISMKLAKELKSNPMHIAENIVKNILETKDINIDVIKPGYINFSIMDIKKNDIISIINNSKDLLSVCQTKNKKKLM